MVPKQSTMSASTTQSACRRCSQTRLIAMCADLPRRYPVGDLLNLGPSSPSPSSNSQVQPAVPFAGYPPRSSATDPVRQGSAQADPAGVSGSPRGTQDAPQQPV